MICDTSNLPVEIKDLLSSRGFIPLEVLRKPDGGLIRSWVVVIRGKRGKSSSPKRYVLKYFWEGTDEAKRRFLREINFLRLRNLLSKKFKTHVLKLKGSSLGQRPWIIIRYFEGSPLSVFLDDIGIKRRQFDISSFENFANFLLDESLKKPKSGFDFSKNGDLFGFYDFNHVKAEFRHYKKENPALLSKRHWKFVESFIDENARDVFSRLKVSHRDLYPENFLFKAPQSRHFKLLDWEYVSYVPIGFDATFFVLLFWREQIWRDRFYALSLSRYRGKKRDFNLSFRFCTAFLAIRFLYQIGSFIDKEEIGEGKRDDLKRFAEFLRKRLRSAISGSLVKPADVRFMISGKVIEKILKKYDIGSFKSYKMYYLSKGNTVFKVNTTCGAYVFRIYNNSRPLSQVKREIAIFDFLSKNKIPTYRIIRNIRGRKISNLELYGRRRRVAVLKYLRGGSPTRHEIGKNIVYEAGQMLSKMHRLKVVHGDYSKRNVLFYKGKISGVIDLEFGKMGAGRRAVRADLAKALALWCMSVTLKSVNIKDRVRYFLKGYWGRSFSERKMRALIPEIISTLEKEERIHRKVYGGFGGESFGIIRKELESLLTR